jgi:hypothetical protein
MNFDIIVGKDGVAEMAWTRPTSIAGAIWLSLNIDAGKLFNAPSFGLDLQDVRKISSTTIPIVKQRIEQALKWLLDTNKAKSITVLVERDSVDSCRINWRVDAVQADGIPLTVTSFRTVGGPSNSFVYPT